MAHPWEIILLTLLWSSLSDRGDTFPESIFSLQEDEECIFKILQALFNACIITVCDAARS